MKVYINKHEVIIFKGARVGDAVLSYSERSYNKVMNGKLLVMDCFGNPTEVDGNLIEGQEITLTKTSF